MLQRNETLLALVAPLPVGALPVAAQAAPAAHKTPHANFPICQTSMVPGGMEGSSAALAAALPTASTLHGQRGQG